MMKLTKLPQLQEKSRRPELGDFFVYSSLIFLSLQLVTPPESELA
jgi:hypothetical protein